MDVREKRYFKYFLFFGIIAIVSASIPELGWDYFSGYDGLGRGAFLALIVTTPASIVSVILLVVLLWNIYRRKHPKS